VQPEQLTVMQHVCSGLEDGRTVFTWLNRWRVWNLQFALTWQPYGGGGSGVSLADTERMSLAQAMAWYRWIGETREAEAESIKRARADAQRGRRG
jgi:hypothetical protein